MSNHDEEVHLEFEQENTATFGDPSPMTVTGPFPAMPELEPMPSLDEIRRNQALGHAVGWAQSYKHGAPAAEVVVMAAKVFEAYLKDEI